MELVVENLKGDLLELKKEIAREKEALFYFIRTTAETLKEPETLPSFITFPVEFFLEKIPSRPDILAMKENIRFQGIEVDLAKGEFLPFVDLQGNYYVDRTGIRKEVDWDAMISLTFPLFSFGKRKAGVLKAKESLRLSELKERQLYEQIKREVREKYAEVLALQDLEKKRENVLRLAEKQVKDNEKDLFRGLITTLEFLDSLNGLYQAELLYILTRLQKQKAILELYVISGFSPEEIL
jgi:outer membrane protein TolC